MPPKPDLTTYYVLHRVMRADAGRFAAAVARVSELDRTDRASALARWFAGYQAELHDHHVIEDEIFFPALVDLLPDARALIDRTDADHERLSYLFERIEVALERLGNSHVPFRLAHSEAVMLTDGLHALLESHLAFEDDQVVPLFGAHFSAAQYDELETQARKHGSIRNLAFTIPWIMDGARPDERERLFGSAPVFFKLLWRATRGRYRRIAAAAFEAPVLELVAA
jgi:hemerythrin-like domain-containing protein